MVAFIRYQTHPAVARRETKPVRLPGPHQHPHPDSQCRGFALLEIPMQITTTLVYLGPCESSIHAHSSYLFLEILVSLVYRGD